MTLPDFRAYRVEFRAVSKGILPPLPTTAFHGALGRALRREVCVAPARTMCRGCPVERTCAYPRLFDPAPSTEMIRPPGVTTEAPRPLVMAPDPPFLPTTGEAFRVDEGTRIALRIVLSDSVTDTLPPLRRAFKRLARRGLGNPRDPRGPELEFVGAAPLRSVRREEPPSRVSLVLLTPLRVKHGGRIVSEIESQVLVEALVRRAELASLAAGSRWRPSFDPQEVASRLRVYQHLRVVSVSRYSARQRQKMTWPGMVGTVELEGSGLDTLWPILEWAELAQLGKATSFGFGRFRVEPLRAS